MNKPTNETYKEMIRLFLCYGLGLAIAVILEYVANLILIYDIDPSIKIHVSGLIAIAIRGVDKYVYQTKKEAGEEFNEFLDFVLK